MLRNPRSGRRRDHRRRRRNVERPRIVAAGPARIHHALRQDLSCGENHRRMATHRPRIAGQLFRAIRPSVQRQQQLDHHGRLHPAGQQLLHQLFGLGRGQLAPGDCSF